MEPPSTVIICPVMYEEAGRQRKATIADMSLGSPRRLTGDWDTKVSTFLSTYVDFYNKNNQIDLEHALLLN